jgi:hypothetical protein
MRTRLCLIALALSLAVTVGAAWAAPSPLAPESARRGKERAPGEELARTISTVTGVAISPLLGASAVGAWDYFNTPAAERANLPWYAQTWFWLPGLLIVAAAASKDLAGTAMPAMLKKPLDAVEALENKVSGLIVAGAFVPLILLGPSLFGASKSAASGLTAAGFATLDAAPLLNILGIPFAVAAFAVVWLVSHAINVLILLSPWGVVDAILKSARTVLLSALTVIGFVDPWAAALLSLAVIIFAVCVAGWSFRLAVFGSVFVWDLFTLRRLRFQPAADANWAFSARKIEKVPVRTYGRLAKTADGKWRFVYRPLLVSQPRTLELPAGSSAVGRGLLFPSVVRSEDGQTRKLFNFPPRCRTHEDSLARIYGVGVEDVGIRKVLSACFRELFGGAAT